MSFGLHAVDGRAMHVVVQNGEWSQYGFVPFNPETLQHEPTAELDRAHVPVSPRAYGDHVSAWGQWQYGLAQNYHALHISMATGQVTSDAIASSIGERFESGPPLPYLDLAESGDGVSWMGVHYREPRCRHPATSTTAMPGAGICVDEGSWPRSFSEVADLHAFGGGTMALLAEYRRARWETEARGARRRGRGRSAVPGRR